MQPEPTVVIGVGNEYRRDDGVGSHIARHIAVLGLPGVSVQESTGECASLIDLWQGAAKVILVDAIRSGAEPGTVRRFDASERPLPAAVGSSVSTHGMSIAEAVELARSLGKLPSRVVFFGVECDNFEHGEGLSPLTARAVHAVAETIRQELCDDARGDYELPHRRV